MSPQGLRRKYAETLRTIANVRVEAVVEAFAQVPREAFLAGGVEQTLPLQELPAAALRALTEDSR